MSVTLYSSCAECRRLHRLLGDLNESTETSRPSHTEDFERTGTDAAARPTKSELPVKRAEPHSDPRSTSDARLQLLQQPEEHRTDLQMAADEDIIASKSAILLLLSCRNAPGMKMD